MAKKLNRTGRTRTSNQVATEGVLTDFEDLRLYHPAGRQRPLQWSPVVGVAEVRAPARKRTSELIASRQRPVRARARIYRPEVSDVLPWRIAFRDPGKVIVCLRRRARRQVLHALKLTRKGGRGARRWKWTSGIRC